MGKGEGTIIIFGANACTRCTTQGWEYEVSKDVLGVLSWEEPKLRIDLGVLDRLLLVGTGGYLACRSCCSCLQGGSPISWAASPP